jgi:PKD repeat protein
MKNNNSFIVFCLALGLSVLFTSCNQEQQIPVVMDFDYAIPQGGYTVPMQLAITNKTTGADFYNWTFEGGVPTSSTKKQPGPIAYAQAGTYVIRLEAWNDTQRKTKEITVQLDSAVTIGFDVQVLVNDFVPALAKITNRTKGASSYEWTFDGGVPSTSTLATPPAVEYTTSGEHIITLKVKNGRETFTASKTITLKPAMQADFDIAPSFEDQDYEAPLTAALQNKTTSGLRYVWSSSGGTIANVTSEQSEIYFAAPGDYTVSLKADNDKETKTVQHTITVKPNSNLYKIENVKLGTSAAHATIGSYYSTKLRKVFTKNDVISTTDGPLIDLLFYGINSSFGYCRFVSPDSASNFTFAPIPANTHTSFVNTIETSTLSFTVADFDAMTNDAPLANLPIKANDTSISFFTNSTSPRIVLFETQDGRKGAIKVTSFVSAGLQSYILVDIKVQK